MRRRFGSLKARLLLSHLAVVSIGVLVVLVASNRLSSVFVDNQLRSMESMMGGMGRPQTADVEEAIRSEFNRALLWATLISGMVAMVAALVAASRVLRPLEEVRRVVQRLATGSYGERVPVPDELELAEMAHDVNSLAAALEQTEQRRLQLVSEVAHELRTPVTTVKGYLEGILDGVFTPDEETLTSAIAETNRIERLASDLGTLSRTQEGQIHLQLSALDLSHLARDVAERLRPQFEDNGVELIVDTRGPNPGFGGSRPDHPSSHQSHRQRTGPTPPRRSRHCSLGHLAGVRSDRGERQRSRPEPRPVSPGVRTFLSSGPGRGPRNRHRFDDRPRTRPASWRRYHRRLSRSGGRLHFHPEHPRREPRVIISSAEIERLARSHIQPKELCHSGSQHV